MNNEYFSKSSKPEIKIKHESFFLKGCVTQIISFVILLAIIFFVVRACDEAEKKSGKSIIEVIGSESRKIINEFDKGWNDTIVVDTISTKLDTLKIK